MKWIDLGRYLAAYVALFVMDLLLAIVRHDFSKYDGTTNTVIAMGFVIMCALREERKP